MATLSATDAPAEVDEDEDEDEDPLLALQDLPRETVSVTWGKQLIAPRQYNNFEVGPFSMTTEVRPGEKPFEAMKRAYEQCAQFARASYKEKIAAFELAVASANAAVKGGR